MITGTKRLILVDIGKDRPIPNSTVVGNFYTFLNEKGEFEQIWGDRSLVGEKYKKDIQNVEKWDDTKAKDYKLRIKLFQGKTSWNVI